MAVLLPGLWRSNRCQSIGVKLMVRARNRLASSSAAQPHAQSCWEQAGEETNGHSGTRSVKTEGAWKGTPVRDEANGSEVEPMQW